MSLRVFLARTAQGWQVMPGGFARIGTAGAIRTLLAMPQGGAVADVWVVADEPVPEERMLPARRRAFARARRVLPSVARRTT